MVQSGDEAAEPVLSRLPHCARSRVPSDEQKGGNSVERIVANCIYTEKTNEIFKKRKAITHYTKQEPAGNFCIEMRWNHD